MLPSAAELEYFIEVANSGNISRAAERLGITQPSLSLSLKRLEDKLGSKLVIRTKTGVQLTPIGLQFQNQSRFLLDEWHKIKANTLKQENEIQGHYRIGCHPSVALYSLPHFLPKIMGKNPGLEIHLRHDLSRKITEEVISFNLDFGIVVNPVQHPDLVIRELCKDVVTLWQSATKKTPPAVLIYDPHLAQSQDIIKKLKRKGHKIERSLHSTNLEVITSLVAANTGIGVLPTRVATRLASQKLKPLAKDAPKFLDQICLIYRSDAPKTAASRYIAAEIEKALKGIG